MNAYSVKFCCYHCNRDLIDCCLVYQFNSLLLPFHCKDGWLIVAFLPFFSLLSPSLADVVWQQALPMPLPLVGCCITWGDAIQGNATDVNCFVFVFWLVPQCSLHTFASLAMPCWCHQVNGFYYHFSHCATAQLACCCIICGKTMLPLPCWFFNKISPCAPVQFVCFCHYLCSCCIACHVTQHCSSQVDCCFMFFLLCCCIACKQQKLLLPG